MTTAEKIKKPDWRLPEYRAYPMSRIASAMQDWARKQYQPRLLVVTKYTDGSQSDDYYDPATKEVPFRHDGETYYQTVDIPNKYVRMGEVLTVKQLLAAETQFIKKLGFKIESMTHSFETND